jgi:peptide-methionine (S)-S-oxide reductase
MNLHTSPVPALMLAVAAVGPLGGAPAHGDTAVATFAGGCFWCMEPPFDKLEGVESTVSGYMGGQLKNPTYKQVSRGGTGHAEVVQVTYDNEKVTYETLLEVYWRNVDVLDAGGQFCDRGDSYRPEIFYHTEAQAEAARASKAALQASGRFDSTIVVPVTSAGEFYPAEGYHQDYYLENSVRYKYYRWRCGRDARLQALWGEEAGGVKAATTP